MGATGAQSRPQPALARRVRIRRRARRCFILDQAHSGARPRCLDLHVEDEPGKGTSEDHVIVKVVPGGPDGGSTTTGTNTLLVARVVGREPGRSLPNGTPPRMPRPVGGSRSRTSPCPVGQAPGIDLLDLPRAWRHHHPHDTLAGGSALLFPGASAQREHSFGAGRREPRSRWRNRHQGTPVPSIARWAGHAAKSPEPAAIRASQASTSRAIRHFGPLPFGSF
jgi:hypothetical protein